MFLIICQQTYLHHRRPCTWETLRRILLPWCYKSMVLVVYVCVCERERRFCLIRRFANPKPALSLSLCVVNMWAERTADGKQNTHTQNKIEHVDQGLTGSTFITTTATATTYKRRKSESSVHCGNDRHLCRCMRADSRSTICLQSAFRLTLAADGGGDDDDAIPSCIINIAPCTYIHVLNQSINQSVESRGNLQGLCATEQETSRKWVPAIAGHCTGEAGAD